MRSSVIDVNSSPNIEVREPRYEPFFQPQAPKKPDRPKPVNARHSAPHRRLILAPFEGWLVLALLAVALYCVVFSVIAANWVSHSYLLLWSPALGLLIGLIVAKISRFSQAVLHIAACLVGHWLAVWLTSAVAFHISWLQLLGNLRSALAGQFASPAMLASGESVFFFYLTFLCFFLGYFGSWLIYRAHLPWLVALVYCSIMLVNLNFVRQETFALILVLIMVGALILLIARMRLVTQMLQWTQEGLYTERTWLRSMTWRCMQIATLLTLITVLTGWLLPIQVQSQSGKAFWDGVDNAANNISNGHVSLQDPASMLKPYQPPTNFFGDQLTISGNVELPVGEVLIYSASDKQPHYLEGFTYNHFDGHTWTLSLTPSNINTYDAKQDLTVDNNRTDFAKTAVSVKLVVPPEGSKHYLFAPAQPFNFSVPTQVYSDVKAAVWTQQSPLVKGEDYQVTSLILPINSPDLVNIPLPKSNQDLWSADGDYAKLALYYTEYPSDLSPNTINTVRQWTQGSPNAYSAMKMLEAHLSNQQTFTYRVNNPPIPRNVDVVDYLLQTHIGYCTYYATAMAVMGRMLGVPTRVVNGFSSGHFDAQRQVWSVLGSDAHSWVQAYFPNYGWASFDPTPGYSPNATPSAPTPKPSVPAKSSVKPIVPTPHADKTPLPVPPKAPAPATRVRVSSDPVVNQNVLMGLSIGSLLLSFCLLLAAIATYWWRNLYANSSFVAGMYWRFCYLARWAGLAPRAWQTPYEYSQMLGQHFPQKSSSLWRLTELFVRDRWGSPSHVHHPSEEKDVEQLWPTLRNSLVHCFLRKK